VTQVQPDLDRTPGRRCAAPAQDARVRRTAAGLHANGITVQRAANSTEAKRLVLNPIPAGSHVHQGASQSLQDSGMAEEIVPDLEDARAVAAYRLHSGVNKVLVIHREWTPGRITVVLCDEALGF
jgi:hypothetical protein